MSLLVKTHLVRIPAQCGGRTHPFSVGLRPRIRFQRDIEASLKIGWDALIVEIGIEGEHGILPVDLQLSSEAISHNPCAIENELFELMDGYRVIGVGKIISITKDN